MRAAVYVTSTIGMVAASWFVPPEYFWTVIFGYASGVGVTWSMLRKHAA
jgi:hypothetical protein